MVRKHFSIICFVIILFVQNPAFSADWPCFLGPNLDGISREELPNINWTQKQPELLWKLEFDDDSYSGPSVVGGKVYIVTHAEDNDIVKCIDIKTGADVWNYAYPNQGRPNYGFTRATPSIYGSYLVTLSRWGLVICLETKTGKLLWTRDLGKDFGSSMPEYGHAASPLIDRTKVIVCPGSENASVAALDLKTGRTIWKGGGSDLASYSTPVKAKIQDRWQYVVFSASCIKGVDVFNGKLLWSVDFKTQDRANIASPIVIGNSVFVSASYNMGGMLVDISPDQTPSVKWKNRSIMALMATPVLLNGYLYGVGDPELLTCLDPKDGSKKWSQEGFEKGPSLAIGEYLLTMVGNTGEVVLSKPNPDKYVEISRMHTFHGQAWTSPVYSNGYLLIRTTKAFGCYDMR